jgi:hypothetical protein
MTKNFDMTGKQVLENLEKHCEEKIQCSFRLRFQITETLNRMIKDHKSMKTKIECVMKGFNVYDPTEQKAILLSKKNKY